MAIKEKIWIGHPEIFFVAFIGFFCWALHSHHPYERLEYSCIVLVFKVFKPGKIIGHTIHIKQDLKEIV